MENNSFARRLVDWQREYGRHQLPWQSQDPYCVWISEIMLQQTQVSTVLNYYPQFLKHFPDTASLATAPLDDVVALWSGLGYYSRARNLHHAAKQIINEYDGVFPHSREALETLKGVGRSTAAAIAVFAYGQREAILDGNVKRVLARHVGIEGITSDKVVTDRLWRYAEARLPENTADLRSYTQGLMDLGSLVCTRSKPNCSDCPVSADCFAYLHNATAQLPNKKQRKPLPEKSVVMLLLRANKYIHLYRRPDSGIWRNLWSLPEFSDIDSARAFAERYGTILCEKEHTTFTHRFTHYALHITPLCIEIDTENDTLTWFSQAKALKKGIPKPIRNIIEKIAT